MGTELGNIEAAELIGTELKITGHKWVGLAFAFDDAYEITRFIGVHPTDITEEKIEHIINASDVYEYEMKKTDSGVSVRFWIWDKIEVCFHCADVITEFRYYTEAELHEIFQWLPAKSTPEEMKRYIEDIEKHGFEVTNTGDNFSFNRVGQPKKTV